MIIRNILGKTLYKTNHKTMRAAIEDCALKGVDLSFADFRKENLCGANLDGLIAKGACFWGADLREADIGLGDLRFADLRCSELKDTCFAQTDMTGADLRGAYFSGTVLDESVLDRVRVSCPSFWNCDLQTVASFKGLVFTHRGEFDIPVDHMPVVVRGLDQPLVLHEHVCLWGEKIYPAGMLSRVLDKELFALKARIEKFMRARSLQNATQPIPKIGGGCEGI